MKSEETVNEIEDIKKVLNKAIEVEDVGPVYFNVILVNNEYIHELNRVIVILIDPTDVLHLP